MGYQPALKDHAHKSGIENTGSISDLEKYLKEASEKGRKIHLLPPYRAENKINYFTGLVLIQKRRGELHLLS
jgi:Xaa-Pro aminopeptidase